MHLAFVVSRVPRREELAPGVIDAEWLAELGKQHRLMVLVDHDGDGGRWLGDRGVDVHVSAKQMVAIGEGSTKVPADHEQARVLLLAHEQEAFDAVVYSAERTVDLAWFQPALATIPRGVALGDGLLGQHRLVLEHPRLFGRLGRYLWAASGVLGSMDFVLSDVAPAGLGLPAAALPTWLTTGGLRANPWSAAERSVDVAVVVATTEDITGLSSLLERVVTHLPVEPSLLVVIHRTGLLDQAEVADLVLRRCPARLRDLVLLTAAGPDGTAAQFLDQADLLIAATPADLSIRKVAEVAAETPTVVLSGEIIQGPRFTDHTLPAPRRARAVLVPAGGDLTDVSGLLSRLEEDDLADAVVLHEHAVDDAALRLSRAPGLIRSDVALLCAGKLPYGDPDPNQVCLALAAFSRSVWPSLRAALPYAGTLRDLVRDVASTARAEQLRTLFLPNENLEYEPMKDLSGRWDPTWHGASGILARPNRPVSMSGAPDGTAQRPPARPASTAAGRTLRQPPAAPPPPEKAAPGPKAAAPAPSTPSIPDPADATPGDRPPESTEPQASRPPSVRQWANEHRWTDRVRLALPWKWGLISRAMRGRW